MVAKIDISGTITNGGVAQTISTGGNSAIRNGLLFQNQSAADLYVNFGADASAGTGSIKITSGSLFVTPPNMTPPGIVSVYGATTGQQFTAWEW